MPRDRFGRRINYLRLSLTDRCNLRCVYCMPTDGIRFLAQDELLTPGEYELIARAAVRAGFDKFRLTGGEPTLHPELIEIVERVRGVIGGCDLSLTTNGLTLAGLAEGLSRGGLDRVNIHLDSLDSENVRRVMRWIDPDRVWAGVEAAERAGLEPIKLNAVVVRDHNDGDVVELARLTVTRNWHVRFVELMPLGDGECGSLARSHFVSNVVTRARIEDALGSLQLLDGADPADESTNYRADGARGVIGFISPVSAPYCGACNRMRLTADGKFHLCLLNDDELDVRRVIRAGGDADEVEAVLRQAVALKPSGHHLKARLAVGAVPTKLTPLTIEGQEAVTVGPSTRHREMYQLGG